MAIAGAWRAGAITPSEYLGAEQWGSGVNPIHGVRVNAGRPTQVKEPLLADVDSSFVPEEVVGPAMWGYSAEDAAFYGGEDYRYLVDDHPNWGQGEAGRPDRDGDIMTAGLMPQPEGFPSWGPHEDDNPVDGFPVGGPPGGAALRAHTDGFEQENRHAIAVPTPGWRGGWLNKAHGAVELAEGSDPSQYEVATSYRQLHETRVNTAAVTRGTDDARAPIDTRLTGQKEKHWAMSSGMGGGPGTPDMRPVTQNLPYRPWFFRGAAVPPPPNTFFGTMSSFEPIERTLPADAGESVTVQEVPDDDGAFGYAGEDPVYG